MIEFYCINFVGGDAVYYYIFILTCLCL